MPHDHARPARTSPHWLRAATRLAALLIAATAVLAAAGPASALTGRVGCSTLADSSTIPPALGHPTCWTVSVPLVRGGDGSLGNVELGVEEVRKGRPSGGTAILALTGGPGQSGLPFAGSFAAELARVPLPVITLDQRGTGVSRVVDCRSSETQIQELNRTADCAASLGAAASYFRTADTVQDIEAVRQALGYSKLIVFGVSYGTYVAQQYAAAYPANVSKLVLDSPIPVNGAAPFTTTTFAAFRRILSGLCSAGGCATGKDVVGATSRLLTSIAAKGTVDVSIVNSAGRRKTLSITTNDIEDILYDGDFDTRYRSWFPSAVAMALRGDWSLLARLVQLDRDPSLRDPLISFSSGLFIATVCSDQPGPWPAAMTDPAARLASEDAALAAEPAGTFAPFSWQDLGSKGPAPDACAVWPASPRPPVPVVDSLPPVPTLILNGRSDSRTPIEGLPAVTRLLPQAKVIEVPNQGHSVDGTANCTGSYVQAWLLHQKAKCKLNPRARPLPSLPTSVREFGSPRSTLGQRIAFAFLHTYIVAFNDAGDDAFGSLYGGVAVNQVITVKRGSGRARESERVPTMRLSAYSAIPGVTVSGVDRYRLVGRAGDGTAKLTRSRYTVRLPGGKRVRFVLSPIVGGGLRVQGTFQGRNVNVTMKDPSFDRWRGVASFRQAASPRRIELHHQS